MVLALALPAAAHAVPPTGHWLGKIQRSTTTVTLEPGAVVDDQRPPSVFRDLGVWDHWRQSARFVLGDFPRVSADTECRYTYELLEDRPRGTVDVYVLRGWPLKHEVFSSVTTTASRTTVDLDPADGVACLPSADVPVGTATSSQSYPNHLLNESAMLDRLRGAAGANGSEIPHPPPPTSWQLVHRMDDPDPTPVDSRSGRPGHWTGTLRADLGMSSWTLSPSANSDISTPPFNQTWHPSVMPFDGDWWHWRQPVQLAAPESSECAVTLSTAAGDPVRGVADIYVVPGSFPLRYEYLVRPMADEAVVHAAYADRTPDDGMPCPDDGPTDYPLGTSASLDLTGREPPDTSPYVDRIASSSADIAFTEAPVPPPGATPEPPRAPTPEPPPAHAACANGLDDDGDGLADFPADPGCASAVGAGETNEFVGTTCGRARTNWQRGVRRGDRACVILVSSAVAGELARLGKLQQRDPARAFTVALASATRDPAHTGRRLQRQSLSLLGQIWPHLGPGTGLSAAKGTDSGRLTRSAARQVSARGACLAFTAGTRARRLTTTAWTVARGSTAKLRTRSTGLRCTATGSVEATQGQAARLLTRPRATTY